jgi:hypothetical protein
MKSESVGESMIDDKSDPTKDSEFQKVIRHFVTTPPKPHSEMKIGKRKAKAKSMEWRQCLMLVAGLATKKSKK